MEDKQKCRMETMFKSALDKVTDCILAVSLEGNLLYVNKQFMYRFLADASLAHVLLTSI